MYQLVHPVFTSEPPSFEPVTPSFEPVTPNFEPFVPNYDVPTIPIFEQTPYFNFLENQDKKYIQCLHQSCIECNGTGVKKTGGMCVHMISCPCPRCSPYSL